MKLPIMKTENLILRETTVEDAMDMFLYASRPDVGPLAGWSPHKTVDDSRKILEHFENRKLYGQLGQFAICLQDPRGGAWGQMIGTIGLNKYEPGIRAELGFVLSSDYWNHGFMTEAGREVIKWAFTGLGLQEVRAIALTTNIRSCRVLEKIGMQKTGTVWQKRPGLPDDPEREFYAYLITRKDYFGEE